MVTLWIITGFAICTAIVLRELHLAPRIESASGKGFAAEAARGRRFSNRKGDATDGIFESDSNWLRGLADRDDSPERRATRTMTEIELVGGPDCGTRPTVWPGQAQYRVIRNGVCYRYDRTAKVVDGRAIFWITGIIVSYHKQAKK